MWGSLLSGARRFAGCTRKNNVDMVATPRFGDLCSGLRAAGDNGLDGSNMHFTILLKCQGDCGEEQSALPSTTNN